MDISFMDQAQYSKFNKDVWYLIPSIFSEFFGEKILENALYKGCQADWLFIKLTAFSHNQVVNVITFSFKDDLQ